MHRRGSTDAKEARLATLVARAGGWIDQATDALGVPIQPSTSFLRDPGNPSRFGRTFRRDDNPTFLPAEALLCSLEGGAGCRLFASGMAATTAVLQTLSPGDHVLVPRSVYAGLWAWLNDHGARWGLVVDQYENGEPASLSAKLVPERTRIVWVETPSNPIWEITDLAAVARLAHEAGAIVAVDNTVSTPIVTRPIEHGADVVVHSASKYLNGHADVVAGAVVVRRGAEGLLAKVDRIRNDYGAVLGPFEAWLMLRGMRTLALRVAAACASALVIARHLQAHPNVETILYPGLPQHPGHAIARAQMSGGFGGMLSFRVAGGQAAALAVTKAVRSIRHAISFGGLETVIEHRRSMEGPASTTPDDLLRLSVGIENVDDLLEDLDRALDRS